MTECKRVIDGSDGLNVGLDPHAPPRFHSLGCWSVRIRSGSQALMEDDSFRGAGGSLMPVPVNNVSFL